MKVLIALLLLFSPLTIQAATCSNTQVDIYEKLANQIQTTFDYVETDNSFSFTVAFHNVHDDLYLVNYSDFDHMIIYKDSVDNVLVASNLTPGKTYTFHILNKDKKCASKMIDTITIDVPDYNPYYKDVLCEGIEEFEWCKKWSNVSGVSYETFQNNAQNYKQAKEQENVPDDEPVGDQDVLGQIRNFVANYYMYIVGAIVFVGFIIVIIISKHRNKKFKF